jgi:peptidoglycan/LPS O-acetylase OafA/YrhL
MTEQAKRPSARHISSLDGFRGIAFLLVFVRHYSLTSHMTSWVAKTAMNIGQGGWIGVDLFFALSGFLITGILLDTRSREGYFRFFFARRALRIFPLYYGVAVILLLLTPVLHLHWQRGQLAYLFYCGNIAAGLNSSLTIVRPAVSLLHLWSLAVEEQFYLLWPFVIFLIPRLRHLAYTCAALSVVALLLRLVLLTKLTATSGEEWSYNLLFTHMDGLLLGSLGAIWVRARPLDSIVPVVRKISVVSFLALIVVFYFSGSDFHALPLTILGYPLLAAMFTSLLLQALERGSLAARLGNLRILRFFGKYSYGLYVYHYLLSPLTAGTQSWFQVKLHSRLLGGLTYVCVVFLATTVVAMLSFQLYEKQWLKLKRFAQYGPIRQISVTNPSPL